MSKKELQPVQPSDALKMLDDYYAEARDILSRAPQNFTMIAFACLDGDEMNAVTVCQYGNADGLRSICASIVEDPNMSQMLMVALLDKVLGRTEGGEL